jgi:hypothetical protein
MGIITALVIVFSQVFYFQASNYAKKEVKKELGKSDEKSSDRDNSYITLPSISQSSSTHVEVGHESSFLQEILFEDIKEKTHRLEIPFSLGSFFNTLFRVIISPNAP